jgi:Protein of unknown function (DUF732)
MRCNHIASVTAAALLTAGVVIAAPAHADPDIDFADRLHSFGIYGARDYNAWMGKIVCKRLNDGLDDAHKSADFVSLNLPRGSTPAQAWQFVGAAIGTYCPDQTPVLQRAAEPPG